MNFKDIQYTNFDLSELEEVTTMAIESFQANNVFSKEGLQSREQLQFRTKVSIQLFHMAMEKYNTENKTNVNMIKVLKKQNKIIAITMACQLHTFLDDILTMVDPEDPYTHIFRYLNREDYPKGRTVFASLFVVHKDYMNQHLGKYLIQNGIKEAIQHGFEWAIGTSTNPISLKLAKIYGGQVLKELQINRNNKAAKIYLARISFNNLKNLKSKL